MTLLERGNVRQLDQQEVFEALRGIETVVVLSKGWRRPKPKIAPVERPWRYLGLATKLSCLASGILNREGFGNTTIFSGGKNVAKWPSEGELMREYTREIFPDIPEDKLLIDGLSIDTADSAENLGRIFLKNKIDPQKAALISIDHHVARSLSLFDNYDNPVAMGLGSIRVIKTSSGNLELELQSLADSLIGRYNRSIEEKISRAQEAILNRLLKVDRLGKLPRRLTLFTRNGKDRSAVFKNEIVRGQRFRS